MNLSGGIPVIVSKTTPGAMIGNLLGTVAERIVSVQGATVASDGAAPGKTLVYMDTAPDYALSARSVAGALPRGLRVVVLCYPPRGILVLGGSETEGGAPALQQYDTPGTFAWTKPPGLVAMLIECQGAGGQGGGCAATIAAQTSAGGGAAGGTYSRSLIQGQDLPATATITVPAGGSGAAVGATGTTGGDASFDALVIAAGGPGGSGGGAAGDAVFSSSGGGQAIFGASVGQFVSLGQDGFLGMRMNTQYARGGAGGASPLGGGGSPFNGASGVGLPGNQYGGGGAGAHNAATQAALAGAVGAGGLVVLTYYYA